MTFLLRNSLKDQLYNVETVIFYIINGKQCTTDVNDLFLFSKVRR